MKLKWTQSAPAQGAFEPGGPVYRVRSASFAKTANPSVRAALAAVFEEALRLAPANLDRSRSCRGRDREHQKERDEWLNHMWMMSRAQAVRAWLDGIVAKARPRWKKLFPKRAIRLGFKDHDKKQVQTLGDGKFKAPYARG